MIPGQSSPEQAAIIVRIYEEFVDGRSPREIAARLNAEGVPSPSGGRWSASSINGDRVRKRNVISVAERRKASKVSGATGNVGDPR